MECHALTWGPPWGGLGDALGHAGREDPAPLRRGPHLDEGEAASPACLLRGLKGTSSDSFLF